MFSPVFHELASPVRAKLIEEIKRSDGLAVGDLADFLGMSYMGVKQHCINLEKAGFLKSVRIPRSVAGRPQKLYRLTSKCDDLFPSPGADVTIDLLEEVCAIYGESAAEKVLFRFFQKRKEEWKTQIYKGKSLVERATRLVELRDKVGAFSRCHYEREHGFRIEEFHNPLQSIYEAYPSASRLELLMMEDLLGAKIKRSEISLKGLGKRTVYLINTLA